MAKRTTKELAMGMLWESLTSDVFDAEDAIEEAKQHDLNLSQARAEKVADMANEILLRLVEKRIGSYLEKRGDDISSPNPLRRAVE